MHVEQVMFRSGQVRCAGDLYLPDGIDDLAPAPAVVMAAGFFDQYLRRAPRFVPSPTPEEARQRGLRPEYHTAGVVRAAS